MALSKIRLANKRARHEFRRKNHHERFVKETRAVKIRNKRMRKMMEEGRREHLAKRRGELKYIKELESEVMDEEAQTA